MSHLQFFSAGWVEWIIMNKLSSPPILSQSAAIAWCVAFGTEALAVVIFNLLTVVIIVINRQMRKRKFYLLLNLAIADFIVGAVAMPYFLYIFGEVYGLWKIQWMSGHRIVSMSIDIFSAFSSIISLVVVSLERLFATFWPFRHRALDRKVYFVSIALIWVLATFPPSIHAMKGQHIIPIKQMGYIWIPFLVVLFLIIYISYVAILIKVRGGTQPQGHGLTERNRKLTISLLILTVVSLVTWMPFVIYNLLYLFKENLAFHPNTLYFFKLLHFVNSMVNPIIYALRIPKFRKAAIDLLHCRSLFARQREDIPMANVWLLGE